MSDDVVLKLKDIGKSFEDKAVLSKVNLELSRGKIASLLGPSGCGKTTMLRLIAGFDKPDHGSIEINGQEVSSPAKSIAPEERKIGLVFQDYALFPHLTVNQNLAFALDGWSSKQKAGKVEQLLKTTKMEEHSNKLPHQLSGGQQQRVALARALAPEPEILLLDEPFSNLDPKLRNQMKLELKELLQAFGVTALLVTHNQDEAFDIADEIGVVADGKIRQWGHPYDLYHRPESRIVAEFLGHSSFLQARLNGNNMLETELGELSCQCYVDLAKENDGITILLRPDDVVHDDEVTPIGLVKHVAFRGMFVVYDLELPSGKRIQCFTSSHHDYHKEGSKIGVRLDMKHVIVMN